MNIIKADFELTAVRPDQYPVSSKPEVAFVGRSNVGKSSIINSLSNRKSIARVGARPGMTKVINFYNVDDKLYFVDLPGYGYASVSKGKKSSWETVVEGYLYSRLQLKMIIMLVDIRHSPSKEDKLMYEWILNRGIQHYVVATKADKISRGQYSKHIQVIRTELGIAKDIPIMPYSSLSKQGRDEVLSLFDSLVGEE